jgi:hypothetical protein
MLSNRINARHDRANTRDMASRYGANVPLNPMPIALRIRIMEAENCKAEPSHQVNKLNLGSARDFE